MSRYPPDVKEEQLEHICAQARDWQITHGLLLKYGQDGMVRSVPINISLFPSLFPKHLFQRAVNLQTVFNQLYMRVAADPAWLYEVLQDDITDDPFASILWDIYTKVQEEGYVQELSLGIFRSDYMLHDASFEESSGPLELKQVEFNTFSVAGASHAYNATRLHHYLKLTGLYEDALASLSLADTPALETSDNVQALTKALAQAHFAYGTKRCLSAKSLAILFVVQPYNVNIADERPIEYQLASDYTPPIAVHRLEFDTGQPILQHTSLGPSRELLYHHPTIPNLTYEISVVYFRAGYELAEYPSGVHGTGAAARYQLERSLAIKCPDVLAHMATFKKVQHALTKPENIAHFLEASDECSTEDLKLLMSTFMEMYSLDGLEGRSLAMTTESARDFVLKPSAMEGGGHNIFRQEIPLALENNIPVDQWKGYILMKMIQSPQSQRGILLSQQGDIHEGETISELGILGTCLWSRKTRSEKESFQALSNDGAVGWTMKTKPFDTDEMSVVKGYGCFDSLLLT